MPRKFINRRSDAGKERVAAEDEWAHITNLGDDEKKLDIQDVMDIQERSIFINNQEQEVPQTHWEKTKEATRNAMDRAGNTSQYIKYVNHHFEKQKSAINKVKEVKANYERELKLLQNDQNSNVINSVSGNLSNKQDLHKLKASISNENEITRNNINELKDALAQKENELKRQENSLKQIDQQINQSKFDNNQEQQFDQITNEILELSKKIDPSQINQIIKSLDETLEEKTKRKAIK